MRGSVGLYPKLKKSKYGIYKEAWHLLRGEAETVDIEGCAEEIGGLLVLRPEVTLV
jgi:hypothetical protein